MSEQERVHKKLMLLLQLKAVKASFVKTTKQLYQEIEGLNNE